jgi:hypothetical protein
MLIHRRAASNVAADTAKWAKVVQFAGIKAE